MIKRRKTYSVYVGPVPIGSAHPIVIQSMTNTKTADVKATVRQIQELTLSGSELVRLTVNTDASMQAVEEIAARLKEDKCLVPLIADFHFNGHILLEKYPRSAKILSKYRINPGNVGKGQAHDEHFARIIEAAVRYQKPIRIGVNSGSVDESVLTRLMDLNRRRKKPLPPKDILIDAMVTSALESAKASETLGLGRNRIILSVKMSSVADMVCAYEKLAARCRYPLHLGLTEAGAGDKGIIASSAGLGILLSKGIGDTIRISLTPQMNSPRSQEVHACKHLLQALGLQYYAPEVISCPGCGRTSRDYFEKLSQEINAYIQKQLPLWVKKYPNVVKLKIAVMGCVVNGPGESRHAHIGISLPGDQEAPKPVVYIDGRLHKTLSGPDIKRQFLKILETYIQKKYR